MRGNRNIGFLIMITVAWWGLMYPEYCMSENVVEIVYDISKEDIIHSEKETKILQYSKQGQEAWENLLMAAPEDIVVKSRFYECIKAAFEK